MLAAVSFSILSGLIKQMKLREKLTYLLICIGSVGAFAFTFCTGKVSCPAFDENAFAETFAYTDRQQIIFATSNGESDTFLLRNTNTTAPYEENNGLYGNRGCFSEKAFQSEQFDTSRRPKFILRLSMGSNYGKQADFYVKQTSIYFNVSDTSIIQATINGKNALNTQLGTTIIGNQSYPNVQLYKIDTTELRAGIYQVYYSKPHGIIGYKEYPSLKQWAKI